MYKYLIKKKSLRLVPAFEITILRYSIIEDLHFYVRLSSVSFVIIFILIIAKTLTINTLIKVTISIKIILILRLNSFILTSEFSFLFRVRKEILKIILEIIFKIQKKHFQGECKKRLLKSLSNIELWIDDELNVGNVFYFLRRGPPNLYRI